MLVSENPPATRHIRSCQVLFPHYRGVTFTLPNFQMTYKQIMPAVGWSFVYPKPKEAKLEDSSRKYWTRHRVAAWALKEDGSVVGLIPFSLPNTHAEAKSDSTPRMIEPPPLPGGLYMCDEQISTSAKMESFSYA